MKGRKPNPARLRAIDGGAAKLSADQADDAQALTMDAPPCPAVVASLPEAKAIWDRFIDELVAGGLMALIYEGTFANYCVAYARWVEAEAEVAEHGMIVKTKRGHLIQNPYLAIAHRMMEFMHKIGDSFGMSPQSIARAQRSAQGELFGDDFDDYINGHGRRRAS